MSVPSAPRATCGLKHCNVSFDIPIEGWPHHVRIGEGEDRRLIRFCTPEHVRLFEREGENAPVQQLLTV